MPQDNQVTVGKAPKKRLTDIDVSEVSLVDRPANEEEFAVVKSLKGEEGTMSATNTEANSEAVAPPTPPVPPTKPEGGDPAKATVAKAADAHQQLVTEKLAAIAKIAEEVAKGATTMELKDLQDKLCAMESASWGLREPVSIVSTLSKSLSEVTEAVAKAMPSDPSALVTAFKKIAEIASAAVAELEKAKGGTAAGAYPNPKGYEYGKPMKKGVRIQLDSDTGEVGIDEVEAVEKGARFTPARAAAIKSAIMSLINIAKEVDATMLPEIAKACGAVAAPGKDDKVKKSEDDSATITKLQGEVETLTKKLADAEKVRVPGNADPIPGGNATPVKKDAGSIWEGVL